MYDETDPPPLAPALGIRTNQDKRGKVFAFDKDLRRLALMRRRVDESGASAGGAIETRLQDFLEVDPADRRYSKVGSGLSRNPRRFSAAVVVVWC